MKKIIWLITLVLGAIALVGCGNNNQELKTIKLKIWGAANDQAVLGELVDEFKELHPEKDWDITIATVGENDARTTFLEDPSVGADIFSFAGDHIRDLVKANALLDLEIDRDDVKDLHSAESLEDATLNGKLYAFPQSADNAYFMYYDKRSVNASDLGNFSTILDKAATLNKKVYFDISNGFYIAGFFFATGGYIGIDENGKQVCDFNNANGLIAAKGAQYVGGHSALLPGNDEILTSKFGNEVIAGVSGPWNYNKLAEAVGEANLGITKMPEFTVDGNNYQTYSFFGYKLTGVNNMTSHPDEAVELAKFLTGYRGQELKFLKRNYTPTNPTLVADARVQASPLVNALALQAPFGYSQKDVLGKFWTPTAALGQAFVDKELGDKTLQQWLNEMVIAITE